MSKYFNIFKTSFKQEKDTIFDMIMRCFIFFVIMYILIQLWSYIYGDNGTSSTINGYTLNQMIWYLVIGECLINSVRSAQLTRAITNEIKTGNIAYKMNKPYNYYLYNIWSFMAKSCFMMLFTIPTAVIIGLIFIGIPTGFTLISLIPCLVSIILSVILSWSLYGVVALIAFWAQDSTPFYWIVSKIFMLLGMFFPVEFFPTWLQPIIRYSPVYSIMSGPSSLVANFSWRAFLEVSISQISWSVIIIALGLLIYKLGKRKVVSNGG